MFGKRRRESHRKPFEDAVDGGPADLTGKLDQVRVVNLDDGWGFGKLYTKGQVVSFTGQVADLYEGADVRVQGTWQEHDRYGWQVRGRLVSLEVPGTAAGARAWLAYRFEDIGPTVALAIVTTFPPPELWEVLEHAPDRLQEVDGVGPVRAASIADAYAHWKHEREQFEALANLGLKPAQIRKAVDQWGKAAVATVEANPYRLRELPGIGWKFADNVAMKAGVKRGDARRIHAGLDYAMECREREGDTCAIGSALRTTAAAEDILNTRLAKVTEHWQGALDKGVIVERDGRFYRAPTLFHEEQLARCIARLMSTEVNDG